MLRDFICIICFVKHIFYNYVTPTKKKNETLTNAFLMLLHTNKYNAAIEDLFIEICRYLSYNGLEQTPILSCTSEEITYKIKL